MKEADIHIDTLAFGGSGVGRIDGKVCFVPMSCPGDTLRVRITAEKRSYLTADIVEIAEPSPRRVIPVCPLFGSCGGCGWQHVEYSCQLESKRQIMASALLRGVRISDSQIADVMPSPQQYNYRSRVQFKLHFDGRGLKIGFFRHGSHIVANADDGCPIALPLINESLQRFRSVLAYFPVPSAIFQITIDTAEQGAVAIIHCNGGDAGRVAAFFSDRNADLEPLTGLYLQVGRTSSIRSIFGDDRLVYSMPKNTPQSGSCSLAFRAGGFSQVNSSQNRTILALVRAFSDFNPDTRLLDLYCGNGNFSLPFAGCVASITGIEEYPASIAAAIDNGCRNGIHNAEYICADTVTGVRRLADNGRRFDTVILDPPRSGAADAIGEIARLEPDKIVYISCDPSTLARDCGLLASRGYHVQSCVPVDMFPQTYHLESVTVLQRGL